MSAIIDLLDIEEQRHETRVKEISAHLTELSKDVPRYDVQCHPLGGTYESRNRIGKWISVEDFERFLKTEMITFESEGYFHL